MSQVDNKQQKKKAKGSAAPFIFFAVVTYFMGLPIFVPAFFAALGLIVWKTQKDAAARDKLPPIPPPQEMESDFELDEPLSADQFGRRPDSNAHENQWDELNRTTASAPPLPFPASQPWERAPAPERTASSNARFNLAAPVMSKPSSYQPRGRQTGLAVNFATQQSLRQSIVAMTVLGPPRALDPFHEDPRQRGVTSPPP